EQADQRATSLRRDDLADINRGKHGRAAEGDAADEAKRNERLEIPCDRAAHGADQVKQAHEFQHIAGTEAIAELAREHRAAEGAPQGARHGAAERRRGEMEHLAQRLRDARDHGRIEAEQQACETRNDRYAQKARLGCHEFSAWVSATMAATIW